DANVPFPPTNMLNIAPVTIRMMENVEDARMAIFILEDLQKNRQLSKMVADEDILMFAEKITTLRNMRHFDTRKKRIYEIQSLDSFLTENNFSSAQNAVYFSSIIDNWEFANNFTRASGIRVSLGVTPNLSYINENYLTDLKTVNFSKGVEISANLLSEAPLSLKWQRRAGLSTGYLKSWDNEKYTHPVWEDSKREGDNDIVYFSGNYGYGFYPDSRSYHQLSIGADASKNWYNWDEPSAGDTKWYWRYNVSLYFSGYFYFTEKLNLTYGFNVGYEERNTKNGTNKAKINNFATSFNVSLLYSIF
ncbi:MAG TPA: hypothetical protein VHO90_13970, partial [Bacteroidales bacterium]|nr:hypothetical protein [Bacteroidales bacterium]